MASSGSKQLGSIELKVNASDLKDAVKPQSPQAVPAVRKAADAETQWQRAVKALERVATTIRNPSSIARTLATTASSPSAPPVPPIPPIGGGTTAAAGGAEGAGAAAAAEGGAGAAAGGLAAAAGPVGVAIAAVAVLGMAAKKTADAMKALQEMTADAVEKYRMLNPRLAVAASIADVQRTLADLRSAQVRGPSLAFAASGAAARDTAIARLGDLLAPVAYAVTGALNYGIATIADMVTKALGTMQAFFAGVIDVLQQIALAVPGLSGIAATLLAIRANVSGIHASMPRQFQAANQWALDDIAAMSRPVDPAFMRSKGVVR